RCRGSWHRRLPERSHRMWIGLRLEAGRFRPQGRIARLLCAPLLRLYAWISLQTICKDSYSTYGCIQYKQPLTSMLISFGYKRVLTFRPVAGTAWPSIYSQNSIHYFFGELVIRDAGGAMGCGGHHGCAVYAHALYVGGKRNMGLQK